MRSVFLVFIVLLLTSLIGCTQQHPIDEESQEIQEENNFSAKIEKKSPWEFGGSAIEGKYADADVINTGDKYRMYYSEEPEVQDFKGRIYSATSKNGIKWTKDKGARKEWATFPSVIRLENNEYRMYFQNSGEIKSAVSMNGVDWKDESGIRIDKSNELYLNLENVAAPTVIKDGDSYLMIYRGTINEKYSNEVPNSNTQLLLWAVSDDGLNFRKKGMALDSRNEEFQGLLDGPELVNFDGEIRLYFWSYNGVYHVNYINKEFSQEAIFDYTTSTNSMTRFPQNPPGDPTLIKINNKWFMYYGQHDRGIYYSTFEA